MKIRYFPPGSFLPFLLFLAACNKSEIAVGDPPDSSGPDGVRIIRLTADGKLTYNVKKITAAPGEKLNIELSNTGTMPRQAMAHNWVVLNSSMSEVEVYEIAMAAAAKPPEFMPGDTSAILGHTRMLGSGEKDVVQITAPDALGTYPYFCTFPGHFALMRGTLVVKAK